MINRTRSIKRRLTVTYPSLKIPTLSYGTANSADDRLSRLAGVSLVGELGQFRDGETGWGSYGFRYYLPWLGRWTDRDPLDEDGEENLYSIVFNDTVNRVDFLGLATGKKCCPNKGDEKDDYGTCCKKGSAKPNPADPSKLKCQVKEEKDKKKGVLRSLFRRCRPALKIKPADEGYKGSGFKVEAFWKWFSIRRANVGMIATAKVDNQGVAPDFCGFGVEIK